MPLVGSLYSNRCDCNLTIWGNRHLRPEMVTVFSLDFDCGLDNISLIIATLENTFLISLLTTTRLASIARPVTFTRIFKKRAIPHEFEAILSV